MKDSAELLSLPYVEMVEYENNFISTAVCELRFPALLEYETEPPVQLQKNLRKTYPHYEPPELGVLEGPGNSIKYEKMCFFRSKHRDWSVSFRPYSIALETNSYTNFGDFLKRLEKLMHNSKKILDSDFFTRVGLRYINEIHIEDGDINGWVRDDLIGPLDKGVYGRVGSFAQKITGLTSKGQYTFRHGLFDSNRPAQPVYRLDFDFYKENVPYDSVSSLLTQFSQENFCFFRWAIGQKAIDRLGKVKSKQETL